MNKEELVMLTQPVETSGFTNEVALNFYDDVSPFAIQNILYSLGLEDNHYKPTDLALDKGLPSNNQELVNAIGQAAMKWESVTTNTNAMLQIEMTMKKLESHPPEYVKVLAAYNHERTNVHDYQEEYRKAFQEAYSLINE